jgi:hypothetical protein
VPEGLLNDDAGAIGALVCAELPDHGLKHRGRDRQIVGGCRSPIQLLANGFKGLGISIIAIHIAKQTFKSLPCGLVDAAVFLEAVFCPREKLVKTPSGLCDADDGHMQCAPFDHGLQCGKDFFVGQISCSPEEHECLRLLCGHSVSRWVIGWSCQ